MERNSNSYPSFLKLLIEDDFAREIRIPHAFVRDFKGKLSSKYTLITEAKRSSLQKSWPVRIRNKGPYYYICRRCWPKFVKVHNLKPGDYLIFHLVDKTTFKVIVYAADCCPKKLKLSSSSLDDQSDDSSDDEEEEESNSSEGADMRPPQKQAVRPKTRSKRLADSRYNGLRKLRKSRNSGIKQVNEEIEIESGSEDGGVKLDGHFDLEAENPFFIITLKKHHRSILNIPKPYARKTNLDVDKDVILRGEDKREFPAKIINRRYGRIDIAEGWQDFRKTYNLVDGETCRFTLLKRYGNLFHVQIFRPS